MQRRESGGQQNVGFHVLDQRQRGLQVVAPVGLLPRKLAVAGVARAIWWSGSVVGSQRKSVWRRVGEDSGAERAEGRPPKKEEGGSRAALTVPRDDGPAKSKPTCGRTCSAHPARCTTRHCGRWRAESEGMREQEHGASFADAAHGGPTAAHNGLAAVPSKPGPELTRAAHTWRDTAGPSSTTLSNATPGPLRFGTCAARRCWTLWAASGAKSRTGA